MTPVTPPTSRERRSSVVDSEGFPMAERHLVPPETPRRSSLGRGLMTPSTTRSHKEPTAPLLLSPRENRSLQGYNSPEFTPLRELVGDKEGISAGELRKVSRVLFPRSSKEEPLKDSTTTELLPPTRTSWQCRSESPTRPSRVPQHNKQPKQVPGTPSHRVTTFELAKKWHNNTEQFRGSESDENSDDDEALIRRTVPANPFLSSDVLDEETRKARKQSLLEEDPDVENVITYLNKNGEVVKRYHLSSAEREAYKPRSLFAKELRELESDKEAAAGATKK